MVGHHLHNTIVKHQNYWIGKNNTLSTSHASDIMPITTKTECLLCISSVVYANYYKVRFDYIDAQLVCRNQCIYVSSSVFS